MATLFPNLPTLGDQRQKPDAPPKGRPAVLAREDKRQSKEERGEAFRKAVWARDEGKNRATGEPLKKSGTTDAKRLGEVDHAYLRSLEPARIYDVSNGILLSKYLNRLRKARCKNAPEHYYFSYSGPDDRGKPQTFVWRDDDGTITKERIG